MNIFNIKLNLILAVGLGVTGIFSGLYWYHGAFSHVEFTDSKYGPYDFVYFNRIGSYETLDSDWIKIKDEVENQFNSPHFIGIYYDDPKKLIDQNQARAALGFSVEKSEKNKIQAFLDSHSSYKLVYLPEVKSYTTSFPFKSYFSFKLIQEKVYPKVSELASEKKLQPYCLVESYLIQQQNKKFNFDIPFGEQSNRYFLF
ncbi:glutathione S-transferase, amine-terminal domain protein (macronuclear) [Tetrahymena thermophila SB210]|uniref:Glutathione S-transferase, amine-terminal domain protein n=1 Tax=Tetrahymena thermophila (strain SB210) TaxID=312017 RepID=I7LUN2_TETTS|nr:glutathione S-transferase, amine-terminal domain protein [Tetrahymena thermophila SB210]EAR95015.2 glutathione S-transferase, amine-terminal domain protein [Tetrahymena thermophila SB210]|eukprot:XP_001015260.2 glutathione S-transferase, amine-terminal domain protein [Tetrahymena thermophila SB210]